MQNFSEATEYFILGKIWELKLPQQIINLDSTWEVAIEISAIKSTVK